MVWAGVGHGVKSPLFFIPAGVKVNGDEYREFLRKKVLSWAWNAIPQEVIDRAVDDFPKRLKKCIDAQGGHFENK
uniref:Uncharacterized protein n=1 Tax=Acrobeloides nanus TaxID=290746 RepID=A0A914DNR8_9BILA